MSIKTFTRRQVFSFRQYGGAPKANVEKYTMKKYFNMSSLQKSAFAAPSAPPQTEPDVVPATPETDPDEWGEPGWDPSTRPNVKPDPQNRSTKSGPGPAVTPNVVPETLPDTDEPSVDPDEWGEPSWDPSTRPTVKPDPQNLSSWFKRAQARSWHDNTDRGVRSTWDSIAAGRDPHNNHVTQLPFVRVDAHRLAQESSHHALEALREAGGSLSPMQLAQQMMQIFQSVRNFEAAHKDALERLAESIAAKKLGLPKEMFKAELVTDPGQVKNNPHDHGKERQQIHQDMGEDNPAAFDVTDAIEGQIPMQFLAQGAGLNAMMNFHEIGARMIENENIPGNIIQQYHKLSKILSGCHFTADFYGMQNFASNMGSNEHMEEEWEDEETGKKGSYKIHAKAITFPLLVYELVAGGIRQASMTNLNQVEGIHEHGDSINSATGAKSVEALGFQAGGALDRKLQEFVEFVKEKYPNVDYGKILRTLFASSSSDRTIFFSHLLRDEFEEASRAIRPRKG